MIILVTLILRNMQSYFVMKIVTTNSFVFFLYLYFSPALRFVQNILLKYTLADLECFNRFMGRHSHKLNVFKLLLIHICFDSECTDIPTENKMNSLKKGSETGITCNLPWYKCTVARKIYLHFSLLFGQYLKTS